VSPDRIVHAEVGATVCCRRGDRHARRSHARVVDTSGVLVFCLFGALAEFERQLIRDRTLAGLAAARARGRVGGRPRSMTAAKLRLARAMRKQVPPVSLGRIAVEQGLAKSTVARDLPGQSSRPAAGGSVPGVSVAAGGVAR